MLSQGEPRDVAVNFDTTLCGFCVTAYGPIFFSRGPGWAIFARNFFRQSRHTTKITANPRWSWI